MTHQEQSCYKKKGIIKCVNQNKTTKRKCFNIVSACYQQHDGVSNLSPNDVIDDSLKCCYGDVTFKETLRSLIIIST